MLRASLGCTATVNFFNFVLLAIFILFASRTLGLSAATIGLVLGVGAVGGLVGALIAPKVGRVLGMGRAVVVGAILFPAALALFPLARGSHLVAGALLVAGEFFASVGVMIFDVNQNSLLALHVPESLRSRVFGAYRFMNYGTRPIGALLGGILGSAIGLRETMWIGVAAGCSACCSCSGRPCRASRKRISREPQGHSPARPAARAAGRGSDLHDRRPNDVAARRCGRRDARADARRVLEPTPA